MNEPRECVMDLPFPPSTNRIWRNGERFVRLSAEYEKWKTKADAAVISNGCWRKRISLPGAFTALILLSKDKRAGDIDNRIKVVLDWAQRVEIIKNDSFCEEVTARWVCYPEAPQGCRLIIKEVP